MNTITIILLVLAVLIVNSGFLELSVKLFTKQWLTIGQLLAYYLVTAVLGVIAYFVITKTSIKAEAGIVAMVIQSFALQVIADVGFMKSVLIVVVFNVLPLILLFSVFNIFSV